MDSLDKALDEEIRKINPIKVSKKKKEIKYQYGNYRKKLEKIKENLIIPKKVKVKEISTEQTTKISREAIDSRQEPQLMILNKTNITDNRKTRNKNKTRTYSAVFKGITKKDTNEVISFQEIKAKLVRDDISHSYVTSPHVLNCDTSVCNNSSDVKDFVKEPHDVISSQDDELLRIF